ncbi:ParB-like protein [Paraburkholderia phenoliruptrix]|uniref:ParB-like protein n=1 Tax=Paraburkholderia phenoliruptrix TaxID=252970 RepID=UPI0034CD4DFA
MERFMADHSIHVVIGPDDEPYVVDHHHWARAWQDLGHSDAPVTVVADLRRLGHERFWDRIKAEGWVHPFDEKGQVDQLPDMWQQSRAIGIRSFNKPAA